MIWPPRPRARPAKPAATVPPLPARLVDEFHDRPWLGASTGAMLPVPAEPPPAPGPGLVIEPPPWQDALERGDYDLSALAPPEQGDEIPALATMKPYDPPPWRPPAETHTPLLPVAIPKPDWRLEEEERLARERAETQRDLEPDPQGYPAKRKATIW